VEELDHTPVLWAYWPRMMVAREGAHKGWETKAFRKPMPRPLSRERVFGMYFVSSLRMSSARMKTMLGLAVTLWVCESLMLPFRSVTVRM
jgi:hypothetical protein